MARNTPTPLDRTVGQRISAARKAAGLTVRDLAAQLDWPHTTLNNYEVGRRSLTLDRLAAISAALKCSPAALLVAMPEAATIINAIDGNEERTLQVQLMLEALIEPAP